MELNRDFLKQQEDELSLNYVDLTQNVARNLLSQMQRRCLGEFAHVGAPKNYSDLRPDEFYLCQIDEITFEEKAPQKDAVENVLGAFRAMKHINVIYCLLGDKERVRFFLGVSLDRDYEGKLSANTCGREILEPSIRGNIRGCVLQNLSAEQKEEILKQLHSAKSVGMMEGIPSIDAQKEKFQGTDRLIDVMQGDNWGMVVVASPFTEEEVRGITEDICKVADQLAVLARFTSQRSTGANVGVNETDSFSNNRQKSQTSQTSESKTHNHNTTRATDVKDDNSCQIASTISNGHSKSDTQSFNKSESATTNDTKQWSNGHPSQTQSDTTSKSYSGNLNNTECQYNESKSWSSHVVTSKTSGNSLQDSETRSSSKSENYSACVAVTKATNSQGSKGISLSKIENLVQENKLAVDWLKYIDEVLLARLDQGCGKGLFQACTYLFADSRAVLNRLANTVASLYSGPKGNRTPLHFTELTEVREQNGGSLCLRYLQDMRIPCSVNRNYAGLRRLAALAQSSLCDKKSCYGGNWMSSEELGILMGFPQKEVMGLKLREEVDFGLNTEEVQPEQDRIKLGKIVQCGQEKTEAYLNRRDLDKHTFVAGVTGSGKTTTCQKILNDCRLPFLVIEPAKTEYRVLPALKACRDVIYFTPGRQDVAPFFLNPFELFPGESISSRADMIKATFVASFEMEAAIPQIMESAVYCAYERKGWDTGTSRWRDGQDPFALGAQAFPTLLDFKLAVKQVIDRQGFDDRLNQEYLGSINARIESLMLGAKGQMLNVSRSVDFADLVNRQVVIELEEIRSGNEKSLLMGFILTNLLQAVKQRKSENPDFQHITLVEEAHRLLSRYMPGDSQNKQQGVEVFADMLAEVRKYGESLIIVDQIPDKMTPEVLKNTNTKIVHKLFAQDDKEAIGNTMCLKDEQKAFLSNLSPGRAVVLSPGWTKAVMVQVEKLPELAQLSPATEDDLQKRSLKYYSQGDVAQRCVFHGEVDGAANGAYEREPVFVSRTSRDCSVDLYLRLRRENYGWLFCLKECFAQGQYTDESWPKRIRRGMLQLHQTLSANDLVRFMIVELSPNQFRLLPGEEAEFRQAYEPILRAFVDKMVNSSYADEAKTILREFLFDVQALVTDYGE